MTRYAGVPEGWVHVDCAFGPQSSVGLNKLGATLEMINPHYIYRVFNVGYCNAPASVINLKLFRRKRE